MAITVATEDSFLLSSPSVPHSDFPILYVGSQYIKVGRFHSELPFSRVIDPWRQSKARSVQMAALGFGEWILYFMPTSQMTNYDNALEYEDNHLKSSSKSFAHKTTLRKFIETEKK